MQINLIKALIISILSCLLSGCFLLSAKRYNSALLLNMNPDVKLEIEQIISASSGGRDVTISDETFITNSLLTVESNASNMIPYPNDRTKENPDQYELIMSDNGQCFINERKTKLQWFLFKAKCTIAE